jgi:hypothetical protein
MLLECLAKGDCICQLGNKDKMWNGWGSAIHAVLICYTRSSDLLYVQFWSAIRAVLICYMRSSDLLYAQFWSAIRAVLICYMCSSDLLYMQFWFQQLRGTPKNAQNFFLFEHVCIWSPQVQSSIIERHSAPSSIFCCNQLKLQIALYCITEKTTVLKNPPLKSNHYLSLDFNWMY